jgi:hypothetical protein
MLDQAFHWTSFPRRRIQANNPSMVVCLLLSKDKFAGTAKKKNRNDKIAQRSLVQVQPKEEVTDSNDDNQPDFENIAIVIKPQKYVSPQSINTHALMTGIKHHNLDCIQRINESKASVDHRQSLD